MLVYLVGGTLYMASLVPIYPDEIADRITYSRWLTDGYGVNLTLPACTQTQHVAIPYSWAPNRLLSNLVFNQVGRLSHLRYYGMGVFVAFVSLMLLYQRRFWPEQFADKGLLVLLVLASGLLPFLLSLARPESQVMLHLVGLMWLSRARAHWQWRLFLFVVLAASFFSLHAKAILFFPLLAVLAFQIREGSQQRWVGAATTLLLAGFGLESYLFWKSFFSCPEAQYAHNVLAGHFVDPALLLSQPVQFLQEVFASLLNLTQYFSHLAVEDNYQAYWLPSTVGDGNILVKVLLFFSLAVLVLGAVSLPFAALKGAGEPLWKQLDWWRVLALLGVLLGFSIINKTKNFYDSATFFALALLLFCEGLPLLRQTWQKTCLRVLLLLFLPTALLSFALNLATFPNKWKQVLPSASQPQAALDMNQVDAGIAHAVETCDLGAPENNRRLIVDDRTFLYFRHSQDPMLITYFAWSIGPDPDFYRKTLELMAYYEPSGIILQCGTIHHTLQGKFLKFLRRMPDGLCCMSGRRLRGFYRHIDETLAKDP